MQRQHRQQQQVQRQQQVQPAWSATRDKRVGELAAGAPGRCASARCAACRLRAALASAAELSGLCELHGGRMGSAVE
jgi:hypothetical protein